MLRSWVQKSKSGCTGRKVNVSVNGKLTCMTCCHIKKEMFPTDLLGRLKEGESSLMPNPKSFHFFVGFSKVPSCH